ncbi:MAG: hypothetical protein AAF415_16280 [Pseudomonadota bacterium]
MSSPGPYPRTPEGDLALPDAEIEWDDVCRLAWRPAWSIRSRKDSLAPFLGLLRDWGLPRRG